MERMLVPDPITEVGLKPEVAGEGTPETLKATELPKPPPAVMVTE